MRQRKVSVLEPVHLVHRAVRVPDWVVRRREHVPLGVERVVCATWQKLEPGPTGSRTRRNESLDAQSLQSVTGATAMPSEKTDEFVSMILEVRKPP